MTRVEVSITAAANSSTEIQI